MVFDGGDGVNLGNAYGKILLDGSDIDRAIDAAQRSFQNGLQRIGGNITALGDHVSTLGQSLTVLTAPLLLFGATGIATAASFESAMAEISARTGLVGEDLERISDLALQMGADTNYSAQQAAEAFLQLLSSGQSAEEAIATLPAVLQAAAASGEDLGRTADLVTNILAQFQLGVGEAGSVVDELARASGASSATMGSLGAGFNDAGAVAHGFGLTVNDTAAALAIFAENGIQGSAAGNVLRSMLQNMTENTVATRAAWNELGVAFYNTDGSLRDFNEVILDLDTALSQLPVADQNRLMQQLAGAYGITGLRALLAANGLSDMQAAMAQSADVATIADARMNTFSGRVESLRGSIETLQIEALTPLMNEVLVPMVGRLIEVVNATTEWIQANPDLSRQLVRIGAVVATLGPALVIGGSAMSHFGRAISALSPLLGALMSPLGLVVAAIAAFGLAYETNFLGLRDTLAPLVQMIGEAFEYAQRVFEGLAERVAEGDLLGALGWLFTVFEDGSSVLGTFFEIFGMGQDAGNALASVILNTLHDAFQTVISFISDVALPAVQQFFNWLGDVWSVVGPALGRIAAWFLTEAVPAIVSIVRDSILPAVESLFNFIAGAWELIAPALGQLFTWFVEDALPVILAFISDVVLPGIQGLIDTLVRVWNDVSPYLLSLLDWFINTGAPLVIAFISDHVLPAINEFIGVLQDIWEIAQPYLAQLYDWFVVTALPAIANFIENVIQPIMEVWIGIMAAIWDEAGAGLQNLRRWFDQNAQAIENLIQGIIDKIEEFIETLTNLGEQVLDPNSTLGSIARTLSPAIGIAQTFTGETRDSGGEGKAGRMYRIGARAMPEAFFPGADGQFVPNFDRFLADALSDVMGESSGDTINVYVTADAVRDVPAAEDNGRTLAERMRLELRRLG